ncbi:MAG: Mut7-C RNAse domain-containing protein [Candidatus Bathyarchaeia archaeon]
MKFVIDGMLGKLARWLRMMGHDVKYSNNMDDSELLTIAKKQQRILLTRDFELYQHAVAKEVDAFYVQGQTEEQRLAELAKRFGISLEIDMATSRCPKCNTQVKPVSKEEVASRVEKSTFEHYTEFWECPKCGQVYWQGAHWTKIRETLKTAEQSLQKQKRGSV